MVHTYYSLLLLFFMVFVSGILGATVPCPYDLDSATKMISPSCYANSTTLSTGCCWLVSAAYLYAATIHANRTGEAFLPPAATSACLSAFPSLLLSRGLVSHSLMANDSCTLGASDYTSFAANAAPCLYPSISAVHAAVNLSSSTSLCASRDLNLSSDQDSCTTCQHAVTAAVFSLLKLTKTKEVVPCGMAVSIGIWSNSVPRIEAFQSYVLCLVQVLENVGGLSTGILSSPPQAAPDPAAVYSIRSSTSRGRTVKIAFGSGFAALASLGAIVFLALAIQKRRRRLTMINTLGTETTDWDPAADGPPLPTEGLYIFTKAELKQATQNYDDRLLLGEGGAGKVYLGRLPSGHQVAIKRVYRAKKLNEFYREIQILAKLRHRNLTTIVGYCLGSKVHALVYEYMAGGNLARALHAGELSWTRRVTIAADVAEGLAYLHKFPEGVVVHRDVKPTNVLLSGTVGQPAKLSDFGVSRIMPAEVTHVSTEVRGTMGYVDPDSFHIGHVSESADVYSFGVMLLELVTGMRAVVQTPTGGAQSIVHAARGAMMAASERGVGTIVDVRLGKDWDRNTVGAVFDTACRCVKPYKEERPTMEEVLLVLKKAAVEVAGASPATEETSEAFSDGLTSSTTTRSPPSVNARSL